MTATEQFTAIILEAFARGRLVAIDGRRITRKPQPSLTLFPKVVGR
jgi:hypothetical protein